MTNIIQSIKIQYVVIKESEGDNVKKNKVLYQIKTLDKMIIRTFLKEDINKNIISNITPTQMQILTYVLEHKNENIYQRDLEDVLKLRRATVSGVLQTMEKNNLIVRINDLEDIRIKKIILNKKAEDIFKENEKRMEKIEKTITKDISKEDLDTFLKVIEIMKNNIN